ncbi:MAG: pseudouridine synthase [Eubacteriales bacterium]|nr:pseudouridine synthase [Eubacteriales bacterium]
MTPVPKPRPLNQPPAKAVEISAGPKRRLRQQFLSGEVETVRINRLLADLGISSRRGADELIKSGAVTVNAERAVLGQQIELSDEVRVRGEKIDLDEEKRYLYLLLYKPVGITCTTDPRRRDNIISYLNLEERMFPVGRLDRDSEGLILLTNDGNIVNRILRVENAHEKEYIVTVNRPYDNDFLSKMSHGVEILDQTTLPCKLKPETDTRFRIILRQGLNRQIRRMCEALGYQVTKLIRCRIMHLSRGRMRPGDYRYLSAKEELELLRLTKHPRDDKK